MNILLLTKTRKVIVRKSGAINCGNYHLVVNNIIEIDLITIKKWHF